MNEVHRFGGKVALVTGGASGIGLATVKRLAREGAAVALVDRNEQTAKRALDEIRAAHPSAEVRVSLCDVAVESQVKVTVRDTFSWHDRLDIVVNNAGLMIFRSLEEHTLDDWNKVLEVDLLGAFLFVRESFRVMKRGGAIVNVSSVHAVETTANVAAYAAAKAALVSLTHSAAIEGKPKGLRINAILPGAIDTPMLWDNPNVKAGVEVIDKANVGKPENVAAVIAYLASDDASFVTGASVRVDGGRLSQL